MTNRPATPEVSHMTPYLWALMAMLVSATVFDAFNIAILSTVAPMIQRIHGLSNTEWGLVNLIIRIGAVISFFVLMLADRFGRRAVITVTILGYAVFTGLTGLSQSIETFTLWQFCARIFLAAEFALALIIIGEEYPTNWRSTGIALLGGIGALGTILAFLTARLVLARYEWRTMYLLGLIPVVLVFFVRLGMRETRRFEALRQSGGTHTSLREQLAGMRLPFQRRYRKRSLLGDADLELQPSGHQPGGDLLDDPRLARSRLRTRTLHARRRRRLPHRLSRRCAGGGLLHEPLRPPADVRAVLLRRGGRASSRCSKWIRATSGCRRR